MLYSKYLTNFLFLFKNKKLPRSQNISKYFLNRNIFVHNGRFFVKTKITPFKLNSKLGEYSITRTFVSHKKKKKKKK